MDSGVPHAVFVNRVYWPDTSATAQLLTDLAEGIAASGCRVTVLTRRAAGTLRHEVRRQVRVHRPGGASGPPRVHSLVGKAFSAFSFLHACRRELSALVEPGDRVILLTDPPLLGPGVRRAAEARDGRVFHWVQDIYPEIAENLLGLPGLAWWRRPRNRAWRESEACVPVSSSMAAFVSEHGVPDEKIVPIPNWAPRGLAPAPEGDIAAKRREWGVHDGFVVGYSGNLGRAHDLMPLVQLAARLQNDARFQFVVVGGGAQRASLVRAAEAAHLRHWHLFPPQPRESLAVVLGAMDLHLVALKEGCERLVFPSKLHGIAAVGRPALVIGHPGAEAGQMVVEGGWGETFAGRDLGGMEAFVRRIASDSQERKTLGERAVSFHQKAGGFESALAAWKKLLRL